MYRKLDEAALAAILEAGIAEFARCGFQPASVAAVAARAGVSVGVIYKYFGDKDALFLACVRHSLELLDATLQEAAAGGGTLEARIRRLILALIRQSRAHASYNVMYNEITAGSCRKYAAALAEEIETRTAVLYTRLFDGARRDGVLTQDIEPSFFAFFFDNLLMMLQFSCSCEYYQQRMQIFCGDAAWDDTTMADRLTRFVLGAMKGDVCSTSLPTTSERPESKPACSQSNGTSS